MQDGKYSPNPTGVIRSTLDFQFQIAWQMLDLHLTGLHDEEFHWRPLWGSMFTVILESGWRNGLNPRSMELARRVFLG